MVQAVGGTLQSFMSRQTEIDMFRTLQEAIRQHETDLTLLAQHLLRAFIWARHTRARAREVRLSTPNYLPVLIATKTIRVDVTTSLLAGMSIVIGNYA